MRGARCLVICLLETLARTSDGLLHHAVPRISAKKRCLAAADPRPLLHFTPRQNYMNDPNGLIYYDGEYHLFFQWTRLLKGHEHGKTYEGDKSWGHAVSKNLLHWEELQPAIDPDEHGEQWSGSIVVDWNNSSGLQLPSQGPPMVLFYTNKPKGNLNDQRMAVSHDRGRTWSKLSDAVIPPFEDPQSNLARDPKVQWHDPSQHWIMVLYVKTGSVFLYRSTNLRSWEFLQDIGFPYAFECPDLMQLPVAGDPYTKLWVLMMGTGYYQVADFDGMTFSPITDVRQSEFGSAYAAATFNEEPNGRHVQMAWIKPPYNENHPLFEDAPFVGVQSFPVELDLVQMSDGFHVRKRPVVELAALRVHPALFYRGYLEERPEIPLATPASGGERGLEISIKVRMPSSGRVGLDLLKEGTTPVAKLYLEGQVGNFTEKAATVEVVWDDLHITSQPYVPQYLAKNIKVLGEGLHNMTQMPVSIGDEDGVVHVQILVDWGMMEVYDVRGGASQAVYISDLGVSFGECAPLRASVSSLDGGAELSELQIYELFSTRH